MQAVYSFTAASAGILALTGTTVHMFDVYRKAGANWIKLQQAGQDVSIGHSQPEVSIALPGEYIVVHDNPRLSCAGGATFAFTPSAAAGAADGVVTGMSYTAGVLTLQRSNGLPPLSITIPAGIMPVVQPDGSYLFHNGVDADVSIPAAFVPSNPEQFDLKLVQTGVDPNNNTLPTFGLTMTYDDVAIGNALPLVASWDATGEPVSLTFPVDGVPNLTP